MGPAPSDLRCLHGGYLDGWDCIHDNTGGGTWNCSVEMIIVPDDGKAPTGGLGIDPTIVSPGDGGAGPIGGGPIVDNPDKGDGAGNGGHGPIGGDPVVDNPDAPDDDPGQGDTPSLTKPGDAPQARQAPPARQALEEADAGAVRPSGHIL